MAETAVARSAGVLPARAPRLHYLDGLRGWAAFVVVVYHSTWELFKGYVPAVRTAKPGLLNDGKLAVYVFFVLSGLVLTHPFLATGRRRVIAVTALRRYPRLTIPIAAASAIGYALMRLGGLHNLAASPIVGGEQWLGRFFAFAPSLRSLLLFATVKVFVRYDPATSYDFVLWTMSYELAGSFLVFAMLAVGGGVPVRRAVCYAAGALACLWLAPMLLGFVLGAVCAELVDARGDHSLFRGTWANAAGLACLALAFLGSVVWRASYDPQRCALLALLCVLAAVLSPWLRGLLATRVSRWLGRLSFPLYLMHALVVCSASSWLIVRLAAAGWSRIAVVAAVVPATVLLSLAAAIAFAPVERFAIAASHRIARAVIGSSG